MEFSEPPANALSLAVTELITNSVVHADMPDGAEIQVAVHRGPGRVRVEVCDGGDTFNLAPRGPEYAGGRGLMIVDALSERWGISRDGSTCVWFEMPIEQVTP